MLEVNIDYLLFFCFFVRVLEEMNGNGCEVNFFYDVERLEIFFNYFNYFCFYFKVVIILFKFLVVISICNEVLRGVFD